MDTLWADPFWHARTDNFTRGRTILRTTELYAEFINHLYLYCPGWFANQYLSFIFSNLFLQIQLVHEMMKLRQKSVRNYLKNCFQNGLANMPCDMKIWWLDLDSSGNLNSFFISKLHSWFDCAYSILQTRHLVLQVSSGRFSAICSQSLARIAHILYELDIKSNNGINFQYPWCNFHFT